MRLLFLLSGACFLFSCKPKPVDYSIKGKLVNSCDHSPIKNVKVQARQTQLKDGFNESAVSDANGNFELLISTADKSNFTLMNVADEIPLETVDYGEIPLYSNSMIYYRVKINNPHTSADTLWIVNPAMTNQYYRMLGPFHDTVIGLQSITSVNKLAYNARTKQINISSAANEVKAWYKINRMDYRYIKDATVSAGICNTVADTLTLLVD